MNSILKLSVVIIAMLAPAAARAENESGNGGGVPAAVRTNVEGNALSWRDDRERVLRQSLAVVPQFRHREQLIVSVPLRFTRSTVDLERPGDLPFNATLSLPAQFSLGLKIENRAPISTFLDVTVAAEFETPLESNEVAFTSFTTRNEAEWLDIDAAGANRYVTLRHEWFRCEAVVGLHGRFGRWEPFVDASFVTVQNRLAASYREDLAAAFAEAGINPPETFEFGYTTFFYAAGTELAIAKGFGLRLSGTYLPISDGNYLAGTLGVWHHYGF